MTPLQVNPVSRILKLRYIYFGVGAGWGYSYLCFNFTSELAVVFFFFFNYLMVYSLLSFWLLIVFIKTQSQ